MANASVSAGDVVFEESPSGSNQNLIMQLHGTTLTNLSFVGGSTLDHNPDVSPDGSRIAFQGERPNTDSPGSDGQAIVVMNSDGTGQNEILKPSASPFRSFLYPAWSPDGGCVFLTGINIS